jgi:hypothetical protein
MLPDIHIGDFTITDAKVCLLRELGKHLITIAANTNRAKGRNEVLESQLLLCITQEEIDKFLETPFGQVWIFDSLSTTDLSKVDPTKTAAWLELLEYCALDMMNRVQEMQQEVTKLAKRKSSATRE